MEPARSAGMTGEYIEDPEITPQNHWRWAAPIVVLVALPLAGIFGLRETDGAAFWPSHNSILRGVATQTEEVGAVGTSGRADAGAVTDADASPALIREIETITGQNDSHPLIGRKVELHVPVADRANDQAFWIGEQDNRVLVVPRRDHRDSVERQLGLIAPHGVAALEIGKSATISGSVQKLPTREEMYSWGLTAEDRREVAARGVYVRADTISVQ